MSRPLRAGVIGLGVGERHVAAYQEHPSCEVVGICDLDPDRLVTVGERNDVAYRTTEFRGITEHPDIDLVSICSYDDAHVEQAISALRCGKHVMIEKPISLRRDEAELLLKVHQESGGLILTSNLILRASPRFREVQSMAAAGEFGDIYYMEGDYLHAILWKLTEGWRGRIPDYSVVHGGGIHLIDLMRWIAGREVESVSGMGARMLVEGSSFGGYDTTVSLMRFQGGALAKCTTSLGPRRTKFHALNVYGTKATFVNDMPHAKLFLSDRPDDERTFETPYPAIEKGDLLPDFIAAAQEGREPAVTAADVFRVMDVCFATVDAISSGRTIEVRYSI